jgi:hypothetical protein
MRTKSRASHAGPSGAIRTPPRSLTAIGPWCKHRGTPGMKSARLSTGALVTTPGTARMRRPDFILGSYGIQRNRETPRPVVPDSHDELYASAPEEERG